MEYRKQTMGYFPKKTWSIFARCHPVLLHGVPHRGVTANPPGVNAQTLMEYFQNSDGVFPKHGWSISKTLMEYFGIDNSQLETIQAWN